MENRDIRIAFFDIDGTLLPPDHHLPESTVAALNILRAKGVQLYLATGRPPYHLHYLKKDLPFEFDGMVMMNGQYCRDKDGCFYTHPLPQEGLRELLPWLEKTDIAVSFVEADIAYMNRYPARNRRQGERLAGNAQSSGSYAGKQHRLWRWQQRYRDACFCRDRGCHGQRLARRPCSGGLHYHRCG